VEVCIVEAMLGISLMKCIPSIVQGMDNQSLAASYNDKHVGFAVSYSVGIWLLKMFKMDWQITQIPP